VIIDACLGVLKLLMDWLLTLRPEWDVHLPPGVNGLIQFLLGFDSLLPVHEFLTTLSLLCALVGITTGWKWTIKVVDWIVAIIP
jgi:hypothetical protein